MPWRLINDYLEIDTDLITCAEYQLFIDETETNRQPFHWKAKRFPPGTAKKPVSGVKAEDAVAFCAWLNQQQSTVKFKYRLPTLIESIQYPISTSKMGYWCTDAENFVIGGITAEQWQVLQSNHHHLLELSCIRDLVNALIFLLESISELDINLILILDRASLNSGKYALSNPKVRARNHALRRVREQVRNLGRDLVQELALAEQFALELKQELILENNQVFERLREVAGQLERNLVFDSDLVLDLDLVRDIDLGFKGELIVDLDFAYYLASYREKLLLQTRNFASLLTLELGSELTNSLLRTHDFDQAVNRIQALDLKQVNKLAHDFERALALTRPLYPQKRKEIELAFDCLTYFVAHANYTVVRYSLLLISACWHWLSQLDYNLANLPAKKVKQLQEEHTKQKDKVLNFYSSFVLLEQRQTGKIPPWEGIRLLREQQ